MNWQNLIPTPDALPAPWGIFETLGVLTFVLHILFINTVVGTSLLALVQRFRPRDDGSIRAAVLDATSTKMPGLIALSVTLGVAPLLFVQVLYGHLIYASSVLMAAFWILVVPVLIAGYYGAYLYVHRHRHGNGRSALATTALAVLVAALLYIGFLLTNNMTLMLTPEQWTAYFENRQGFILNLGDPTVYVRYLHFLTASIAVSGLFAAIIWHFRRETAETKQRIRAGLRLFGYASMFQVVVGLVLLFVLPSEYTRLFMGQNAAYTIVLAGGLIAAIFTIVSAMRARLWLTVGLLVMTALLMGTIRAMVRAAYLDHVFTFDSIPVNAQYGPMITFVVILLAGLATVAWMIKAALAAQQRRAA